MESLDIARLCARVADEKRAEDILILQTGKVSSVAEYFILATARNRRQMKAVLESIRLELKSLGVRDLHSEGYGGDKWTLLDYGDVVVHVFDADTRSFYDLESLWADAPRVPLPEAGKASRDSA